MGDDGMMVLEQQQCYSTQASKTKELLKLGGSKL